MTGCERRVRDPETGFKTQVPVPKSAGFEGAFLGSPVVVTRLFLVGRGGRGEGRGGKELWCFYYAGWKYASRLSFKISV